MNIKIINPIWSQIPKTDIPALQPILSYKDDYWRQGPFRKVRKEFTHSLISKNGIFLTGFLPRVKNYLEQHHVSFEITYDISESHLNLKSNLLQTFLQLRPEQEEARVQAIQQLRGVIHYPTGSGKTVIYFSIIDSFKNANALILLHRKDLLYQTYNEAKKWFPGEVGIIGDSKQEPNRITIAMIQTFSKLEQTSFHERQDIVIVDEAHHVSSLKGKYYKVLTIIPATIRLGLTATLPYTDESRMALEGLIGPVIAEKKIQEVQSLAKPIIKLRKIPYSSTVHDLKTWKDVYRLGVVFNSRRHKMVLEDAIEDNKQGRTVLILVVEIQHGFNLMEMAQNRFPDLKIEFVYGDIESESRLKIKKLLSDKKVDVVISSVVWREGIDIPSLGSVINASGGKSEIMTLQSLGRGLRTTKDKKDVVLRDYFDSSHHYLISHFGERISLYFNEGWL
jgi:superfamily II DNA or RNA helicase